jgi:hypothetical protein
MALGVLDRPDRRGWSEHDSMERNVDKKVGTEQLGQDSRDRIAGTGQAGRTGIVGQARQDGGDMTVETGQPRQK